MSSRHHDPDQPVPLVLAPDDFEAQIIAEALNADGIHATVMGSHAQWLGSGSPLSSVNVMVRRAQRMEALIVLRRIRAEAKGLSVPDDIPLRAVDEQGCCIVCAYDMAGLDQALVCPECGANLAEDAAIFDAQRTPSVLHSGSLRVLVVFLIIAGGFVALYVALKDRWSWWSYY